jgi:hypothetical protein
LYRPFDLQMSSFLDFWENGTEITSKIGGPKYWKLKLHSHVQKSVSRRDRKKLSKLIRASAILRDVKNESYYTSKAVMMLVAGFMTSFPTDPRLEKVASQFYRKLPKIDKTRAYREVLKQNALHQAEDENAPRVEQGIHLIKTPGEYALIQENMDESCSLSLLLVNPVADIDICETVKALSEENWQILIDRVDTLTHDLPSWHALMYFIENAGDECKDKMHDFCKSYWRKYHVIQEDGEDESALNDARSAVFAALSL